MRQRALEHVAFLVGQGVTKGSALDRVGECTGVSPNTLKGWEKIAKARRPAWLQIELAEKAGELSIKLLSDPDFAKIGSGNTMDGYEFAKLEDLTKEDLATFGMRYSERHGHRHNPS
jgi:hypothetical protein